jgi:Tfp pilus assembly protein PilF
VPDGRAQSPAGIVGSEPNAGSDITSFTERAALIAARAADEAARLAALAAETAQRVGERQAAEARPGPQVQLASDVADAAMDSARLAADAAREAEQAAAEAARLATSSQPNADGLARREALRARDAAERAWEAAEEAGDRSASIASASTLSTAPPGFLQDARRSMRAETSFNQGRAFLEARKFGEARDRLRETIALYPDHDQARALLAWSEYFVGNFASAIITFKSALRRQPTWEGLYDGLGWSRFRLQRYHLSIAAFRPALDRNPDYTDALNGLGSAQFELGQYDVALPTLEKALRRSRPLIGDEPVEAAALRAKVAWSLYYVRRYRDALATFTRASVAAPSAAELQVGIGWCHIQLGQKEQARGAFRRALQLGPGNEAALEGLRRANS